MKTALPFIWIIPGRGKEDGTFWPVSIFWKSTNEHQDLIWEQFENLCNQYKINHCSICAWHYPQGVPESITIENIKVT